MKPETTRDLSRHHRHLLELASLLATAGLADAFADVFGTRRHSSSALIALGTALILGTVAHHLWLRRSDHAPPAVVPTAVPAAVPAALPTAAAPAVPATAEAVAVVRIDGTTLVLRGADGTTFTASRPGAPFTATELSRARTLAALTWCLI